MDSDTYETRMRVLDARYEEIATSEGVKLGRAVLLAGWGHDINLQAVHDEYDARIKALDAARLSAERSLDRQYFSTVMGATA